MGLYLLVEKRVTSQRLGNVRLNVDEIERKEEPYGLKSNTGWPRAYTVRYSFFSAREEKKTWKDYGWLGLAHVGKRKRKDEAPAATMLSTWATVSSRRTRSFLF